MPINTNNSTGNTFKLIALMGSDKILELALRLTRQNLMELVPGLGTDPDLQVALDDLDYRIMVAQPQMMDNLVEVIELYLTQEEIKELVGVYSNPILQKMVRAQGSFAEDINARNTPLMHQVLNDWASANGLG